MSPTGKSFRVVRACVRAVCMSSEIEVTFTGGRFPFSLFVSAAFPFSLQENEKDNEKVGVAGPSEKNYQVSH